MSIGRALLLAAGSFVAMSAPAPPRDLRLGYTAVYVSDVQKTVEFYERAFGAKRRLLKPGEYGEPDTGTTRLGFTDIDFAQSQLRIDLSRVQPAMTPSFEIGLVTAHVEAAYAHAVSAGAIPVAAPALKPWGQTVSYVRDLNGVLVEICSPLP
jgi:uncharacterized glyoxalase superfamily protein PhnB